MISVLVAFDTWLIQKTEKFAHKCQLLTGITCFGLARISYWLSIFSLLLSLQDANFYEAGFLLVMFTLIYFVSAQPEINETEQIVYELH